ncbi:hypothetical protein DMUE_0146 [Dictyocoela muelleri]|nr:hypothetical protein DMUE_0146 [Dictyocoela muelleri]
MRIRTHMAQKVLNHLSHYTRSRIAKMDRAVNGKYEKTEYMFWKGINKTKCGVNKFILEGSIGFEKMSLREKMTLFIKESARYSEGSGAACQFATVDDTQ